MYRKEDCLSLLKDPEDDNQDKSERTPTLKWHKVNMISYIKQLVDLGVGYCFNEKMIT